MALTNKQTHGINKQTNKHMALTNKQTHEAHGINKQTNKHMKHLAARVSWLAEGILTT